LFLPINFGVIEKKPISINVRLIKHFLFLFICLSLACKQASKDSERNPSISHQNKKEPSSHINKDVPAKVYEVLDFVNQYGKAPKGYVGGREFRNLERLLPRTEINGQKLKYREWDVNPKRKNKNRGKERLVTGSDHSAYFTADHYQSFIKIK
jgi:ribonuclease T1